MPSQEVDLPVTLQDVYQGRTFHVAHRKQVLCHKCGGTGSDDPSSIKKCPACGGTGVVKHVVQLAPGFVQQTQSPCDKCGGKGKVVSGGACGHCRGTKVEHEDATLTVTVDRGARDGDAITFPALGDEKPNALPGDVRFIVKVEPHQKFIREENNLRYKLSISLLEALVGFTKEIKHLDGHKVEIKRESVTKPGQVITLSGEGMPVRTNPNEKGDLFVDVTVRFPTTLTDQQKQGFRELLL
eukprot:TRINITY_DN1025_c0_g1_i1.p1 TRINITY_DN1025_c0_g1~~TRINITY_DN1025_c0_g1_i1.p1  ORF type:complete len:241 (-),score=70.39 TRINITY_DN1025_c0_g1_i1:114-836(-)